MIHYRIKEVEYSQPQDPYFLYQGKEEKEVQLNFGFTKARDVLEAIQMLANKEQDLSLNILYQNQRVHFYFRSDEEKFLTTLQQGTFRIDGRRIIVL